MISKEFAEAWHVFQVLTYETIGIEMKFFNQKSVEMHKSKIPKEFLEEMQGIADGVTKGGFKVAVDDIIAWNDWQEMVSSKNASNLKLNDFVSKFLLGK